MPHIIIPVNTGRKLNVHKIFRRRPGRLRNVLCTFNLRSVSTGICLNHFLNLCFYFHLLFHSLLATKHIPQFIMFDSISLQPASNITEIRNTHSPLPKKKCCVNCNQSDALIFSWNKVWIFPSSISNYFLFRFWSGYRSKNLFLAQALTSHFNEHS